MTLREALEFCRQFKYCDDCPASGYGECYCPIGGGQSNRYPADWRVNEFEGIVADWKEKNK